MVITFMVKIKLKSLYFKKSINSDVLVIKYFLQNDKVQNHLDDLLPI